MISNFHWQIQSDKNMFETARPITTQCHLAKERFQSLPWIFQTVFYNGPSPNIYQRVETQITHLPQRGTRTTKSSIISLCVKNFPLEISKCVPIPKNESHWFAFKKRIIKITKKKNNIHHGHPLFPPVFCGASQTILVKEVPPNSCGANSRGTFGGQNGGTKTKEGWKTGTPERSTCFGEFLPIKAIHPNLRKTFQNPFFHSLISVGDVFE